MYTQKQEPRCPFCGTLSRGRFPVLDFLSSRGDGRYRPDGHSLTVYHEQYLYPWHVNRLIVPGENLKPHQKRPVGYFSFHRDEWILVNQALPGLRDAATDEPVPVGKKVVLSDGKKLLLSVEEGGRMAEVRLCGIPS